MRHRFALVLTVIGAMALPVVMAATVLYASEAAIGDTGDPLRPHFGSTPTATTAKTTGDKPKHTARGNGGATTGGDDHGGSTSSGSSGGSGDSGSSGSSSSSGSSGSGSGSSGSSEGGSSHGGDDLSSGHSGDD
jgi:hypothetical protein